MIFHLLSRQAVLFEGGLKYTFIEVIMVSFLADVLPYLHRDIATGISAYAKTNYITEIRLTLSKPVLITCREQVCILKDSFGHPVVTDKVRFLYTVSVITAGSAYSVEGSLRQGFVTIRGGHRVGVCGTAVEDCGKIKTVKDISSLCFRVSREIVGCGEGLCREFAGGERVLNTLIASPPGYGKTTMLRDICRILASGKKGLPIKKVGIADERGEIAAMDGGVSPFDLGYGCFVSTGHEKSCAFTSMLRAMSPDVLVSDEIGTDEDFRSIARAVNCGVSVVTSIHAFDIGDLKRRFGDELKLFDIVVFLHNKNGKFILYRRDKGDY